MFQQFVSLEGSCTISTNCPVSVIVPFYNNTDTIVKSVQSILEQSLPPAELILLDDGSTDNSFQKIKDFLDTVSQGLTKIHLERFEDNKGVYPVRNYALDIATQPIIAFQDADDFWHLDKLKIQYQYFADDDELHLVCSKVGCYEGEPDDIWGAALNMSAAKTLSKEWVLWRNVMVTISVMIRNDTKFRFSTDKKRGSDMGLWLDIVLSGHKAVFIPTELAFTRKSLFGAGGLSGDIKKAEKAQQKNLRDMEKKGYISKFYLVLLQLWSYFKYLRRSLIMTRRKFALIAW